MHRQALQHKETLRTAKPQRLLLVPMPTLQELSDLHQKMAVETALIPSG
jgi:hypothetical protein